MTGFAAWLDGYGIALPDRVGLIEAGIALALVLIALAVGWYAGRRIGPALTDAWKAHLGVHAEGIGQRLCAIVRHGVAALLLAILARVFPWETPAALTIGVALGAALARLIVQVLRGVGLPRWMTWTVAGLVFVAVVGQALGGLAPITDGLDRIGFSVGTRRLSLLGAITVLVTVVILFAIVRVANRAIGHALGQTRGLDATQRLLAQKLAGVALIVTAFFVGIDLLGIDLTTFAVFSGALGLAIGFGLQKTVGNLIAGIILLMDRSIKPGDVIAVGDSFGWVNKIGVRAVSVITRDGKEHLIPNEILMTQEVQNWSYSDRNVRVHIAVRVAYDADMALAQALMLQAATDCPRVLATPKPVVWITAFGDFAVEHEIRLWIADPEAGMGNVRGDVLLRVLTLFREHGIDIPLPQTSIRMVGEGARVP